jgi:hypothetical protein
MSEYNINEIQAQLFNIIKTRLSSDASVADEVAKILNISSDSAYRRMRGEKQITFEELYILATSYRISLDQLMSIQIGGFMFQGGLLNHKNFRFDAYLTGIMHTMAYFASGKQKELYYLCKDIPLFHHWYTKELAAFKYYFWMISIFDFPEFKKRKVDLNGYPDDLWALGQKIMGLYVQLDSFEFWNLEAINSTLHQIEYYKDCQMFQSDLDVLKLYEAVERTIDHLEEQAKRGKKFRIDDPLKKPLGNYNMYFNEIILIENSIMAVLDNSKFAMVTHTTNNWLMTRDTTFSENFYQYIQNLMRRSTLISEVSEKERGRFFRILREKIARRKKVLAV